MVAASRQNSRRADKAMESWWRFSPLFAAFKNLYYLFFAIRCGLTHAIWRGCSFGREWVGIQPAWDVPFPNITDAEQLRRWFERQGVEVVDAEHALYLPPQPALWKLLPDIVNFYPQDCGFKILKDFRGPDVSNYLAGRPGSVAVRRRLTGSPVEQMVTANYMHHLRIGPRIWDVCRWRTSETDLTVFVVDHVEGDIPSSGEYEDFLSRLRQANRETLLRIVLPNWERKDDFLGPGCRGNLFRNQTDGSLAYVDFQNFRLTNLENWKRQVKQNDNGKPDWMGIDWWASVLTSLSTNGIDLKNHVVIDLQCVSGDLLIASLQSGARWGYGVTSDDDAADVRQRLWSDGVSRFSIGQTTPATLDTSQVVLFQDFRTGIARSTEIMETDTWTAMIVIFSADAPPEFLDQFEDPDLFRKVNIHHSNVDFSTSTSLIFRV